MFETFLGNEALRQELAQLLAAGRLPHAVSISGAEGTGGGFLALLLAEAYLGDTAGLVLRGEHPDVVRLEGSGASGDIKVDDVRGAIFEMNKAAVMADDRRVLLVRRAEHLNENSANALLKMMEEPPAGVLFLLTVRTQDQLLPTIRSRAAAYSVQPLPETFCAAEAQRRVPACTEQRAAHLAALYCGRLGMVLRALTDPEQAAFLAAGERFAEAALAGDRYGAMESLAAAEDRAQFARLAEAAQVRLALALRQKPNRAPRIQTAVEAVDDALEAVKKYTNLKLTATLLAVKASR